MKTQLMKISEPEALQAALILLSAGGLVAFPTDTVYGVGTMVNNPAGISRLYEAKARDANKAIAVLLGSVDQLEQLTPRLPDPAKRLAAAFWPGALTLVVPKRPGLPENLSPLPTVGVRMPDHTFTRALLQASGPLATSSANLSGEASALTAEQVMEQLDGRIELVLDGGKVPGGVASTVVDCTQVPPRILRLGAITEAEILSRIS
jgi:L-threonylcarbamoyladenylate synthase